MGGNESDKTVKEKDKDKEKEAKTPPPAIAQEHSSTTTGAVNVDWSGFQAYSPVPAHGFLASSPQAHPYMWGVQPVMPPYGTAPHPYVAMYPHGGIYAHPSMPPGSYPFSPFAMPTPNGVAEVSGNPPVNMDGDGKPSDAKEKLPIMRSKGSSGSLNMTTRKNNESGKAAGASTNGIYPKSAETASEATSEGSDANSQHDFPHIHRGIDEVSVGRLMSGQRAKRNMAHEASDDSQNSGGGQDSAEDVSQNGGSAHNGGHVSNAIVPGSGAPGALPGTNLNIGMDYWGAPTSSGIPAMHGKVPSTPVAGGIITSGSRDNIQPQLWLQDERELKRQRRKQSNRESARRSRLRKQAECDDLAQRAEVLKEENANLRSEVNRIKNEYEQLLAENNSLKEKLGEVPGRDDFIADRNEQDSGNGTQQNGQTDNTQGGQ